MGVLLNEDRMGVVSFVFDPAALSTGPSVAEQTVTVPGLRVGDLVVVQKPTLTATMFVSGARVSAADTLAITFVATAGTPNAGSETYLCFWFRPESVKPGVVT